MAVVVVVVEEAARMLSVVQQSVVRQIRDRGMHADREYKTSVPYLRDLLWITEIDAAARVRAVERFHPRVGVTGEVLPPLCPAVEALATPCPGADGTRDPRTATRRRADALGRIAVMALDHPTMPTTGGHRPQIVATITLAELQARVGTGWLNNGDHTAIHDGHIHLTMIDGRPHTVPPRWLDPTQRPRRNRAHDRPP